MQITAAMARKYDEENTTRMLAKRLRGLFPADVMSCAPPTATRPLRQIKTISPVQISRNNAIPSSRLSVPKFLATVLEKYPEKIQPAMAPPPTTTPLTQETGRRTQPPPHGRDKEKRATPPLNRPCKWSLRGINKSTKECRAPDHRDGC